MKERVITSRWRLLAATSSRFWGQARRCLIVVRGALSVVFGRVGLTAEPIGQGIVWIERDCLGQIGDSRIVVALSKFRVAATASRFSVVRGECDHSIVVRHRAMGI